MNTLVLQSPGQLTLTTTTPPPQPKSGEALVRVHRIGVCGTDLHAYRGKQPFFNYPRILGHELGVEVLALGEPSERVRVGDRCALEPYLNCGQCAACRRGKSNCCENLRVLGVHTDGGMRELLVVPIEKLHPSSQLTFDQLALIETLAIGAHAVERANPKSDDAVLIIGAGPIGLAVLESVRPLGCTIVVADREPKRLSFIQQHFPGVATVSAVEPFSDQLRQAFAGDLPTIVFDATGNPTSMMQAFEYVGPGGSLVYVGLFQGDVTFADPMFHRKELTLLASRNALPSTFTHLIQRVEQGDLDTTPWITHRSALLDVPVQFVDWLDPANGVVKAIIEV
ncbi:zinc-binding alcohol dehydrogenase family protein [Spirosoma knui]